MERTEQKAVIYCRVSGRKQKLEGHGLESQETRCREFAAHRGYQVVAAFHDDFTGASSSRPAMRAMLDMLKRSRKERYVVIIDDISRLARGLRAHMDLRAAIEAAGGILESPNLEFADDADSEMQEYILATIAQHHRRKNAEQVKNRMRARNLNGYYTFQSCVGYRYEKVEGHGKMLVRDEPIASILQEALEGFASGRFPQQINVRDFLASHPEWKRSKAAQLAPQSICNMLNRVVYAGYIDYPAWGISLVKGKHEPIISYETYQAIQRRLQRGPVVTERRDMNADFPLRGFVTCAGCGKPYQASWSKGRTKYHPYYLCATKTCPDYGKSIRRDVMQQDFANLLSEMRPTAKLFSLAHDLFRKLWDDRIGSAQQQKRAIETELARIDKGITQLVDRIVDAESDAVIEAYERRIRKFEEERTALRERLANCGVSQKPFRDTFRTAMEFLLNPCKLWDSNDPAHKRLVLKLTFVERLAYARNHGFRTALTSLPFTIISGLNDLKEMVVDGAGFEPAYARAGRFTVCCH